MGCHTWFFRPIKENEKSANYCHYADKGYTEIDRLYDLFRVGGYPEDKLLSYEDTLKFINKNKERILFSEQWEDRLKDFWYKNPNGLIEFG